VAGPGWLALGSCCNSSDRRTFVPIDGQLYLAQRFALELNALDADGRVSTGDLTANESYAAYGQSVLAVADATVVAAVDQYPDQTPNTPSAVSLDENAGNHIILDLGNGYFAFYGHLKPESIAVQAGETVTRGQVIGEVGNSGSSSQPHLQFYVMDGPSTLAADGLPYVFDAFDLTGQAPPLDIVAELGAQGDPISLEAAGAGPRSNALPLARDVVAFTEEAAG
jgi:Peptidase family M23